MRLNGRRWRHRLAVLYSAGFSLVLVYLAFSSIGKLVNHDAWASVVRSASWTFPSVLPRMLAESTGVVAAVVVLMSLLQRVDTKFEARRLAEANVNFYPFFWRWSRWPFAALLLWNLPVLAMLEEFIFRHGLGQFPTATWQDVVIRSALFGAAHAILSLNWRGGLVQMTLGFWFSYQYLLPGVDPLLQATMSHFLVDLVALAPVVVSLAVKPPTRPACS